MPTTVEELPAGFWDDGEAVAAPRAVADPHDAGPVAAPSPRSAPLAAPPAPARPTTRDPADPADGPPALAALQGLALLQAVFPGRVVKVERAATADDDAAPDEVAVAVPVDPPEDDPDPGADAPTPRTP